MKLRIKGNSIRLRLLRSEVDKFRADGYVAGVTSFGSNLLRYSLQMSRHAETVYARYEDNEIMIVVPEMLAKDWTASETVGFDIEQPIAGGGNLSILVEKDFVCIDRPDDPDRADAYPNPSSTCTT